MKISISEMEDLKRVMIEMLRETINENRETKAFFESMPYSEELLEAMAEDILETIGEQDVQH